MLNQLTLIMPTFNRHKYALRNIGFWRTTGVRLIVLDGSASPLCSDVIGKLGDAVFYHHLPCSITERVALARSMLDTKYAALIGDDDIFVHSGIREIIRFLDCHQDYVACSGRAIGFGYDDKNRVVVGNEVYPDFVGYEVASPSPSERIKWHMENYCPSLVYSIMRSEVWARAFDFGIIRDINFFAIEELFVESVVSCLGKSLVLPNLAWMRSRENVPVRKVTKSIDATIRFDSWWCDPDFAQEKKFFIETASRECGMPSEHFYNAFDGYYNFCKNRTRGRRRPLSGDMPIFIKQLNALDGIKFNPFELMHICHMVKFFHQGISPYAD